MQCDADLNTSAVGPQTEALLLKSSSVRRRRLISWGIALLLMVGSWMGVSWFVAHKLTQRHQPIFAEPVPKVAWGQVEALRITARDGAELGAWYVPGRVDAPSVLLLHGNGGSRKHSLSRAEMLLAERGCSVLMVSLRAHGDSTGDYNDIGYGARHDVVAAVEWLERRNPGRPIVIHGMSMGAAAATFASRELGHRVRGYILESPYQDLKTAVWNRVDNALPDGFDWLAYRGLMAASWWVVPHLDQISPVEAIAGVPDDVPVLILAGDLDRMARPDEARALWEKVKTHGNLHLFETADHVQMFGTDPVRFRMAVLGLIDAVVRGAGG